jgi:hypothetical protein
MTKLLTLSCILLLLVPGLALADASIIQDYCEQVWVGGTNVLLIHFTVVNFSLPAAVCDVHFIPEPQPPIPSCTWTDVDTPDGWSGFLNPLGAADYFANTPDACIDPGNGLTGFGFYVPMDFPLCCYVVQFTDATGAVILEQEECFACTIIPTEPRSWGTLKSIYR